jgi:beta-N-acetylhexosaminidase
LSKYPLLISADFETGTGMRLRDTLSFPWNMAVAATGDPGFAEKIGVVTGREARALGVRQVFAPVLDINDNPANPVINVRSYGEDPETVLRFGRAFTEGLQSERVIATAKHFPGHGNTSVDSHRGLPEIPFTREQFESNELVPFRGVIDAGVASVMIAHISLPALDGEKIVPREDRVQGNYADTEVVTEAATVPATLSAPIVTGLLKEDLGFKGLVVTDALDMAGLTIYFSQEEAAVRALLAGNDILLKPEDATRAIEGLRRALQDGRIPKERLDEAVLKQLAWKYELGLFEDRIAPLDAIDGIVASKAAEDLADRIADAAVTLVENRNGALPLKGGKKIFLLCVTNAPDYAFVGSSFARALGELGFEVERAAIDERSGAEGAQEAVQKAKSADQVIIALFGRVRSGAENSAGLPVVGETAITRILAERTDAVSVSFGNPYLINSFPKMGAYVVAYGDMESLQKAAAEKIAGSSEFRGRLPISLNAAYPKGTGAPVR